LLLGFTPLTREAAVQHDPSPSSQASSPKPDPAQAGPDPARPAWPPVQIERASRVLLLDHPAPHESQISRVPVARVPFVASRFSEPWPPGKAAPRAQQVGAATSEAPLSGHAEGPPGGAPPRKSSAQYRPSPKKSATAAPLFPDQGRCRPSRQGPGPRMLAIFRESGPSPSGCSIRPT
jgi:hypothetical protein